ncbi:MAG: DUF4340 domain-containing protein [Granulosicoccaceae bacterium]|jgi:hypothetical protein
MSKRTLTNLLLLTVIGLLVLFVWLEPGQQAPDKTKLTDLDLASVSQIRISRGNGRPIVLLRDDRGWQMQTPFITAANPQRVQELLSLLGLAVHNRFPVAERQLQQYGLATPGLSIDFGHDVVLVFGDSEPLGKQRYVLFNEHIHLVTDTVYQQLSSTDTYLIDTRPLANSPPITGLQLPDLALQQDDNGTWLRNGEPADDADAINRFIDNWQHARALFVSRPLDAQPEAQQQVRVLFGNGTQRSFILQQPKTGMSLIDTQTGLRYLFTPDSAEQLLQLPAATAPQQ